MYTFDIILEAYELYNINKSFRKSSKILRNKYGYKITRQTIMNWNKLIKKDFKQLHKKRMNVNYCQQIILSKQKSFSIELMNDIHKLVDINPFISRQEIILTIKEKFNVKLTQNHLSSIFKRLNLTRKKPREYIIKSISYLDKLIEKRNNFKKEIEKIDINKIVSIDESGFNALKNVNKGLAPKGKRINIPRNEKRIKNRSLISSITTSGMIHNEIHETSVNGIIFESFIRNVINKLPEKNYCFILDNVPFHHKKSMLKLIKDEGHTYLFTPPYSPNNNPIETVFGIIKSNFRKLYDEKVNKNDKIYMTKIINESIKQFSDKYDKEKITKLFKHSINYSYEDLEKELRDRLIIRNK
jgi:transposase